MVKKSIAVIALAGALALGAVGCGSSSNTPSTSSTASLSAPPASTSSSIASSEAVSSGSAASASSKSSEAQAATVFGDPQIVTMKSGSGEAIGTCSNFYAAKADCTKENLTDWYFDYVQNRTDKYCVIVFSDDPSHGVYAGNGMIEVGIGLEKDENDDTYSTISSNGSIVYFADSSAKELIEVE